jgi:hypothetical protein
VGADVPVPVRSPRLTVDDFFATSARSGARTPVSTIRGDARDMVIEEQECCAFLKFEMTDTGDQMWVTISFPERARAVADLIFEQFVPKAGRASRG